MSNKKSSFFNPGIKKEKKNGMDDRSTSEAYLDMHLLIKNQNALKQKSRLTLALIACLCCGLFAQGRTLGGGDSLAMKLKTLLTKSHYNLSTIGIVLKNIDRDSIIIALNADTPYNPASISKLTTAAVAYDRLGVNYTCKTPVFNDGIYNSDSGICKGNLYIKGSGDPSIVIERMWILVQYLYRFCGLRTITGDVVLDDSFFDTASIGPCFEDDSEATNPYAAPVNALSANFNTVELFQRPGGSAGNPIRVEVFPRLPTIDVIVKAKSAQRNRKNASPAISSEKAGDQTRFIINGAMARDAEPYRVIRKVYQTWDHFGAIFKMFLDENKIALMGRVRRGQVPEEVKSGKPMYVWESLPLWQMVNDMMKYSTNFYAEMIFKMMSAVRDSGGGSWEKIAALAQAWWKEKGLPGNPLIKNGSGMGDCNRYSANQLSALLGYMWGQKTCFPEWLSAFPIAGGDGTLRSRFKDSRLKGILRGKTGTLNDQGVYTIAGYVLLPKATYSFVVMFNNTTSRYPYHHWDMQQKILELIVP
jgi:D-alanyl-D-alanine carboxypeptidase/D-alanyl-D-alanine-endopeptidase (penicillin-binding protein 4)